MHFSPVPIGVVSAFVPPLHHTLPLHVTPKLSQILLRSKNADRARIEKDLEDMMGNDWRVFRAKLVAQEQAAMIEKKHADEMSSAEGEEKRLQKFMSGAMSSFFRRGETDTNNNNEAGHGHDQQEDGTSHTATHTTLDADKKKTTSSTVFIGGSPVSVEDPFTTEQELPAVMMPPKIKIDKHRWAHSLGHIERGCVLIANEKLGGVFHQTVVLIIDHHEKTGSTGIIINRPMQGTLLKVASETVSNVDLSIKLAFNNAAVSYGGPVMQDEYTCLHGYGEVEGAKKISPGVFVGGSNVLLNEVRQNRFDPQQCLFVKGHAAWVPHQLQREISKGVWYTAAASDDFLLRYAGAPRHTTGSTDNVNDTGNSKTADESDGDGDLWSDVLTTMGGNYAEIAKRYHGRGDKRALP
jgi:putative transcriptional regulator